MADTPRPRACKDNRVVAAGASDLVGSPGGAEAGTSEKDARGKTVGAGRRYYHPLQKDHATSLETSEESGGERTLIEIEVAPGGGNVAHFHKTYDEHFEVIEGFLEVLVGKEKRTLRPGEKVHRFRNPTGTPTTFLVELRPGHAGFEKAIKAGYGLAADGLTNSNGAPKNPYHLAVLLGWSEMRMPGLFTLAEPLFRLLAKRVPRGPGSGTRSQVLSPGPH